jgi:hypothetical protein
MSDSPYETVTTTRHFFSVFGGRASDRDFEIECDGSEVCIYEVYKGHQRVDDSVEVIWFDEGKWVWEESDARKNYFGSRYATSKDFMAAILDHINTHGIPKEIQKEMEESENS